MQRQAKFELEQVQLQADLAAKQQTIGALQVQAELEAFLEYDLDASLSFS